MKYVLCINNKGYPASLDVRKVYRTLPDARAEEVEMLRVIDESGEDYLFPAKYFVHLEVPRSLDRIFSRTPRSARRNPVRSPRGKK